MSDPQQPLVPLRGRGAAINPPNRFEKLAFEADPEFFDPDDPEPWKATEYFRDRTRNILARNDSPDVGFEVSLNPYRGCSHGCIYCLSGDPQILMADGGQRALQDVRAGDEIFGTIRRGSYRRYVKTQVLAHWTTSKPAFLVTLQDGTQLIASGDHRFLTERGWKYVTGAGQGRPQRPHLTLNNKLMGVGAVTRPPVRAPDYQLGYLCGLVRGDALLASYEYQRAGRAHGNQHQFRLALIDDEALDRAAAYLSEFGVATRRVPFSAGSWGGRPMQAIRTHARLDVERIRDLIAWPQAPSAAWAAGFLAGIFDAEGSYSGGILRISNSDGVIVEHTVRSLRMLGFQPTTAQPRRASGKPITVVRLLGGLRQHLNFFHATDPAITRKRNIEGQAVKSAAPLGVISIERLPGERMLYDITTGTGDFLANGVVSHNCYARPTHEYLGFSPGLDFETKIFVKEAAPELLRAQLYSPRWKPQVITMSGVTDCYQPAERRFRITRRCLEVLAEFRNPVAIVTKSYLVTRDIDVLSELARHDGAAVHLSITSLDQSLQKRLEPRGASPQRRLKAVEELAAAGIPVGVMVAPVIPGLTEHELPAILKAAAERGAYTAGYIVMRLPYEVKTLFEDWLERHFPDRKAKVLNRVRELRGGKLNDPRFGTRMSGEGIFAEQIEALFEAAKRRAGLGGGQRRRVKLSTAAFRRVTPPGGQLGLFGTEGAEPGVGG